PDFIYRYRLYKQQKSFENTPEMWFSANFSAGMKEIFLRVENAAILALFCLLIRGGECRFHDAFSWFAD
nr:hypothetical protein [bacterium]